MVLPIVGASLWSPMRLIPMVVVRLVGVIILRMVCAYYSCFVCRCCTYPILLWLCFLYKGSYIFSVFVQEFSLLSYVQIPLVYSMLWWVLPIVLIVYMFFLCIYIVLILFCWFILVLRELIRYAYILAVYMLLQVSFSKYRLILSLRVCWFVFLPILRFYLDLSSR